MALVFKDRVKETTNTTGTGTLTMLGAVAQHQAFSAIGDGNTTRYCLVDANGIGWEVGVGTYTASGTTLARTTVLASSNSGSAISLSSGTHLVFGVADASLFPGGGLAGFVPPTGRLTLTTGVPVTTSDVTGATNIYYTPYCGNTICLWNGSAWTQVAFTEQTLALGSVTTDIGYDVFGFLSGGVLALEKLAWTNDLARATAVTLTDGAWTKSGDKTRLLLGSFKTTSTTETEDSESKRYLSNVYNALPRRMVRADGTSHTYGTASWRVWNNDAANKLHWFISIAGQAVVGSGVFQNQRTTSGDQTAIAFNSSTLPNVGSYFYVGTGTSVTTGATMENYVPSVGYSYMAGVQNAVLGTANDYQSLVMFLTVLN